MPWIWMATNDCVWWSLQEKLSCNSHPAPEVAKDSGGSYETRFARTRFSIWAGKSWCVLFVFSLEYGYFTSTATWASDCSKSRTGIIHTIDTVVCYLPSHAFKLQYCVPRTSSSRYSTKMQWSVRKAPSLTPFGADFTWFHWITRYKNM